MACLAFWGEQREDFCHIKRHGIRSDPFTLSDKAASRFYLYPDSFEVNGPSDLPPLELTRGKGTVCHIRWDSPLVATSCTSSYSTKLEGPKSSSIISLRPSSHAHADHLIWPQAELSEPYLQARIFSAGMVLEKITFGKDLPGYVGGPKDGRPAVIVLQE